MDHDLPEIDDATAATSPLRDLTRRQRMGLAVAGVIVVIGLSWSVVSRTAEDLVPLATNEPLTRTTADEWASQFHAAGLTQFQQQGDQILVPRSQTGDYATVMSAASPAPDNWADEWERQNDRLTPFAGSREREATREIARAKLIAAMLRQLPDIDQADVVWDEDDGPGWGHSAKARATVYLMPKTNRVLTLDVIRSVRLAVAGSKKNLDSTDVVVMDLARQITYEGALPPTIGEDLLPGLHSLAEVYRREIRQHVPNLKTADVSVSIDWPRFLEFVAQHPQDAAAELSSVAPRLLRVSVLVPDQLYPPATGEAEARRQLQQRIASLTGIGNADDQRGDRILIDFDRPQEMAVETTQLSGVGNTSPFSLDRRHAVAVLSLVVMIVIGVGVRRRRRQGTFRATPSFPTINLSSRPVQPAVSLVDLDDLTRLDATTIRSAYAHATPRRWAVALRGSTSQARLALFDVLEPVAAAELQQHCDQLGPVTIGDIESSRQRILQAAFSVHAPAL